jgi:hypothetical protein
MAIKTTLKPSELLSSSQSPEFNGTAPSYTLATVATGVFGRHIITERSVLQAVRYNLAVAGTAGATTFEIRRNGVAIPNTSRTIDNAVTDPTGGIIPINLEVAEGDVIDCNVTAAPTAGTNLTVAPRIAKNFG